MSFHDLNKYSTEQSDKILNKNKRVKPNKPITIFDLFTRPITDLDFFSPFSEFDKHMPSLPHVPTDDIKVDIKNLDDRYELIADLSGVKKEDIKLEFEDGILTIEAVHHQNKDKKDEHGYIIRERVEGSYHRSFAFDNVDKDGIDAHFENQELVITLKKLQAKAKTKIDIK